MRLEANKRLLEILNRLVENNPDQRFSQILRNNSFVRETRPVKAEIGVQLDIKWENEFYIESSDLLKRVERCLEDANETKNNP
jgi:hypothetical protein